MEEEETLEVIPKDPSVIKTGGTVSGFGRAVPPQPFSRRRVAMKKAKGAWFMVFLAGALLFFTAAPAPAEVGVTDTEIRIGTTADLSGPVAFMGKAITAGAGTYFKMINEQGGVHGKKIVFMVEDDGYSPPKAVAAAKKLIEADKVFCMFMTLGAAQTLAMYPTLERAGVPLIQPATQNSSVAHPPRKWLFHTDPNYITQAKIGVEYALNELGMKGPRVGVIYQDDEPGQDYYRGVKEACEHYGLELVAAAPYKRGTVDFSSQVMTLKNAGADVVMMWTIIREPAGILKEAAKLQWKPLWITVSASADNMALKLAGDNAFYGKGLFATHIVTTLADINPEAVKFKEVWPKHNDRPWGFLEWYAWGCAKIMVEGLERAGRDLTREGLIKAFETFTDYQSGVFGPITWRKDKRFGSQACSIMAPYKTPADPLWAEVGGFREPGF
jgi:branched-chain amino acid transport system substrate-binding protein